MSTAECSDKKGYVMVTFYLDHKVIMNNISRALLVVVVVRANYMYG